LFTAKFPKVITHDSRVWAVVIAAAKKRIVVEKNLRNVKMLKEEYSTNTQTSLRFHTIEAIF
jgi:hypothetical protein